MRYTRAVPLLLILAFLALALRVGAQGNVDPRLAQLGVRVEPAADCSQGCFRLVALGYEDDQQSGGRHQIFGSATGGDGRWTVVWPGGAQIYRIGENHGMYRGQPPYSWGGCYDWPTVLGGPFTAYAGTDPAKSDRVVGMGLPQCAHVAFYPAWAYFPPTSPTAAPTFTTAPTRTATPTAIPPGGPGGLMLVELFPDNSVLSVGCADPSSRIVFVGVPAANPQRVEISCVIPTTEAED